MKKKTQAAFPFVWAVALFMLVERPNVMAQSPPQAAFDWDGWFSAASPKGRPLGGVNK